MLQDVEAVRFIRELESGRNRPWLVEAETWDGEVVEVVAKLGSAECGRGGLVREAYSAMLAADLDLPVSEPFVVKLSHDFISTLPGGLASKVAANDPAFGSRFIPNLFSLSPEKVLDTHLHFEASRAITFDAGVVNADRLVTKPNCLTDGRKILLIDHELALNVQGRGLLMLDPWIPGALHHMTTAPGEHLFYRRLKRTRPDSPVQDLSSFCNSLAGISHARISEYSQAIPPQWDVDSVSTDIAAYLCDLVSNAQNLRNKIEALLSP
ncbi:HipA family kinase [Xanthomonas arboricola]|uniref:HipA family kinase n=1 Tax=Xanthomonas arboricola TaxID=56448 RepID=UPI0015C703A7